MSLHEHEDRFVDSDSGSEGGSGGSFEFLEEAVRGHLHNRSRAPSVPIMRFGSRQPSARENPNAVEEEEDLNVPLLSSSLGRASELNYLAQRVERVQSLHQETTGWLEDKKSSSKQELTAERRSLSAEIVGGPSGVTQPLSRSGGLSRDPRSSECSHEVIPNTVFEESDGDANDDPIPAVDHVFRRVVVTSTERDFTPEMVQTAKLLQDAIALRNGYVVFDRNAPHTSPMQQWNDPLPLDDADGEFSYREEDGVFVALRRQGSDTNSSGRVDDMWTPMSLSTYYRDLSKLLRCIVDGPAKTFSFTRLRFLEAKFNLHVLLNEFDEIACSKEVPHRDFYNVRKVDTHIHHSAAMNAKHLQRFIKRKLRDEPDKKVLIRDGRELTLKEVFDSLQLTPYDISVDTLDVHADRATFHRFDRFNTKYSPIGESRLREIFLKTDNFIGGQYLAELTKELLTDLEDSKYQCAEWRISIYGRKYEEWDKLAAWVVDYDLYSDNVRWLIQIPRLFSSFRAQAKEQQKAQSGGEWTLQSFAQYLENIFKPLFDATIYPSKYPKIAKFLRSVVGFDCVDDESKPEHHFLRKHPPPREWTSSRNPPYSYYLFYCYANIRSLNALRAARGLNTFALRPHSGEAGDVDHLAAAFLTSDGIAHGINLRKAPVLQFLYYLMQIGIAMSPLSNNGLFLDYHRNPFPTYFSRGLNVSLSTDDPLQFHYTKEPLVEEYVIAAQVWKLSSVDQCEIARRSVLQSGFEREVKAGWLGDNCFLPGPRGNHMELSNVPGVRICFRHEALLEEIGILSRCLKSVGEDSTELDELLAWFMRSSETAVLRI